MMIMRLNYHEADPITQFINTRSESERSFDFTEEVQILSQIKD